LLHIILFYLILFYIVFISIFEYSKQLRPIIIFVVLSCEYYFYFDLFLSNELSEIYCFLFLFVFFPFSVVKKFD